ncbi:uncharacterized protein LOC131938860 [Physella acuta]|uniref:uncharacterized protein LOC131938860 n=1 Tax=Physella acuta TaxID=109671 RepID=UPI0027DC82CC|nr:uncharacterized protein LOC131938860 [Physella acuta]
MSNSSTNKPNIEDINNMASEKDLSKLFTGTHEVQECLEGDSEYDLDVYKKQCQKSHAGFVPVKKFTITHLPFEYCDNDLYDFTKAMADLIVRIAITFTSPERPEFVPGTQDPYPCYNTRGQNSLRTGTGRVWELCKYSKDMDQKLYTYRTCPCPECDHSDTPSKVAVELWSTDWKVRPLTIPTVVPTLMD